MSLGAYELNHEGASSGNYTHQNEYPWFINAIKHDSISILTRPYLANVLH